MSYINAEHILPDWLIDELRNRIGSGLIYIPPNKKHSWGSRSGAKQMLEIRNREIRSKHQNGTSVQALAHEFYLSEETIKKIVYKKL